MALSHYEGGTVRKLWPADFYKFVDHLLRLDTETRTSRFGSYVSDDFIKSYCKKVFLSSSLIEGYFVDGELRGCSELFIIPDSWPVAAEVSFTVEKEYQHHGVGGDLMERVILYARNRSIKKLTLMCLPSNLSMQKIVKKYGDKLVFKDGEVEGTVKASAPTYFSLLKEGMEESQEFFRAFLKGNLTP